MRRPAIFAAFVLAALPLFAVDSGNVGAAFLKNGVGARALGLGEAYTALADGADALFWNPAGAAKVEGTRFTLNHQPFFDYQRYDAGGLSFQRSAWVWSFGFTQMSYDPIPGFDAGGAPTGDFQAKDQQWVAGFARNKGEWSWGVSGKAVHSTIDTAKGDALALDAGLNFTNPWSYAWHHAIVLQNVGTKMDFGTETRPLPQAFKFGTAIDVNDNLNLTIDFVRPRRNVDVLAFGAESRFPISERLTLAARAGYHTRQRAAEGLTGLGIGAGIFFENFGFDYAWVPHEELGDSHIFTISGRLGGGHRRD
jgi:hypothetical protein